jgi:DNA-binding CsgD family transcriptional regulator
VLSQADHDHPAFTDPLPPAPANLTPIARRPSERPVTAALRLSRREEAIVRLIAAGWSDKEIALGLRISPNTVRSHLDRIFLRNTFHNRAEAAAAWVKALVSSG